MRLGGLLGRADCAVDITVRVYRRGAAPPANEPPSIGAAGSRTAPCCGAAAGASTLHGNLLLLIFDTRSHLFVQYFKNTSSCCGTHDVYNSLRVAIARRTRASGSGSAGMPVADCAWQTVAMPVL